MININKKSIYFDLGISIIFIIEVLFLVMQNPTLVYMGTFASWILILLYSINDKWIYRCTESACPVFWKSPVRKEEIMVSDR